MTEEKVMSENILKEAEELLGELNVMDKSEPRHFNIFELRGEELIISREVIPASKNKKLGGTVLGAGIGAFLVGRVAKMITGSQQGAIVGTILGTLLGGMVASKFIQSPCLEEEILVEQKHHPVITVKEAMESLKDGKGFYITERHKIEAEDGAVYDVTHWVKIDSVEDLISFYNIETGKPPRNDFERIGQLLDEFDYKVLTEDGSIFYHAEGSPFNDAKKILQGKGVNIRKYNHFRKEILARDSHGGITGMKHEDTGNVLIVDKVSTEEELRFLLEQAEKKDRD